MESLLALLSEISASEADFILFLPGFTTSIWCKIILPCMDSSQTSPLLEKSKILLAKSLPIIHLYYYHLHYFTSCAQFTLFLDAIFGDGEKSVITMVLSAPNFQRHE